MINDYLHVEQTIKGTSTILDPRSKLFTTLIIVIGVSLCLEPRQVIFFAFLIIPIYALYRPGLKVFKKLLIFIPIMTIFSFVLVIFLGESIHIDFFFLKKEYSPNEFIVLNVLRFSISMTHSTILLESEHNKADLIDALASLYIVKSLVSILILINRMVERIQIDYAKMLNSATSKGIEASSKVGKIYFRFRILGRILARVAIYSEILSDTLDARGFSSSNYTPTIVSWTSEGITILVIMASLSIMIMSFPFWLY